MGEVEAGDGLGAPLGNVVIGKLLSERPHRMNTAPSEGEGGVCTAGTQDALEATVVLFGGFRAAYFLRNLF